MTTKNRKPNFATDLHEKIAFQKASLEHLAGALQDAIAALADMESARDPRSRLNSRRKLTRGHIALAATYDRMGEFIIDNDLQRGFGILPTAEMDTMIAAMNGAPPSEVRH